MILYLEKKKFFKKTLKKVLTNGKWFDIIARHSAKKRVRDRNRTQGNEGLMLNPEGKNHGAPKPSDKQVRGIKDP